MNRHLTTLISAVAFQVTAFMAYAIPATPQPVAMTQPDGSTVQVLIHGDERSSYITSADGLRLMSVDPRTGAVTDAGVCHHEVMRRAAAATRSRSPLRIAGQATSYPAHGSQKALAVLVEFPSTATTPGGVPFTIADPRAHFERLLNQPGYSTDGATGSVRDYYLAGSNGTFDLTFDVYGPITLERDVTFYSKNFSGGNLNAWNMAVEALRALDSEVDFSQYDRDHDGVIDNVYVFYAGPGAATGGNPATSIWQHAGDVETISGERFTFDGVRVNHYACSNEYRDVTDPVSGLTTRQCEGIGTVTHEFSHVLGLPDFYDTLGNGTPSPGTWALMDTGCHLNDSRTPPCMNVYERLMLDWIEPRVIGSRPETVALHHIADNEACLIPTANANEYFLLENRQQTGWDAYIPGHGMLIWHINYSKSYWDYNQVNTVPGMPGISIVSADGLSYTDHNRAPFPGANGVTAITDRGHPSLRNFMDEPTGVPLSQISENGGVVTFDVCKLVSELPRVSGLTASDVRPDGFTAAWSPVNAYGVRYQLSVCTGPQSAPEYAGAYHDLNVIDTCLTVSGLDPETDYWFTVTALAGDVRSEASEPCPVTTPAMSFAFTAPEVQTPADVTAGSFTARWLPLEGAADYRLSVYTKTRGEADRSVLGFDGELSDLPDGWTTSSSFTIAMNGYFGAESPALSITDNGGRLQSAMLGGDLRSVSFWYRERSGSGKSHIQVSVLADGRWTEIDRVELTSKSADTYTLSEDSPLIPEGARALRLVYHQVDKGSLAIDDVTVTYNNRYSRQPLPGFEALGTDGLTSVPVTSSLEPGRRYFYSVRGIDSAGVLSQESAEMAVDTPAALPSVTPAAGAMPAGITDLLGRRVSPSSGRLHGVYLVNDGLTIKKVIY